MHIHRSLAVARAPPLARRRSCAASCPPPILLVIRGYRQQKYQILLILYLINPTYYYYTTATVFAACTYIARLPSLARRRLPGAASVGCTRIYTDAVPGSISTVPFLVDVCINTTFCSPHYVSYTATGMYYFLARPPSLARGRFC